jgi:hypothetical protein
MSDWKLWDGVRCLACDGTGCTEHGFRDCAVCGGTGKLQSGTPFGDPKVQEAK